MSWLDFPLIVLITISLWFVSIGFHVYNLFAKKGAALGNIAAILGTITIALFIIGLWVNFGRPPLRTLGETRLWYGLFLPIIGLIIQAKWKYGIFLIYCLFMASLFLFIDFMKPETYDKTLMPALQSVWFVPHVVVYILSYAILAGSSIVAVWGLFRFYRNKFDMQLLHLGDNLVYIGFAFLTLGLLFGALWAKEAWGHYWTWDPKETWAFITWIGYLIYMHFRYFNPKKVKSPLWILSIAFIILLICWFGINYLPSAQTSVHVYGS
jgi:cytochrome c-type biogenesis protein CcsB